MHTSKFASFMMLRIVVCIGSDCIENVFMLVGLGCVGEGLVMLMSAWMVVDGQLWQDVGSGENKMSNGCAVELEWRWSNGLTVMDVIG